MAIDKLTKTFVSGEVLEAADLNDIKNKTNELVESVNSPLEEVHVGDTEPTDPNTKVWVDPSKRGSAATGGVPEGGYQRALFEAAGAVWHPESIAQDGTQGAYWLNGLEDITIEQMQDIYHNGYPLIQQNKFVVFSPIKTRTNLPNKNINQTLINNYWTEPLVLPTLIYSSDVVEILNLFGGVKYYVGGYVDGAISYAYSLTEISDVWDFDKNTNDFIFRSFQKLQKIKFFNIKTNFKFENSPLLSISQNDDGSEGSLLYMIKNSNAQSPITITLHPDVLAKANADQAILDALAAHPNVSLK